MIGAPDQIAKEEEERLKSALRKPTSPVNSDDRWARHTRTDELLAHWKGLSDRWGSQIESTVAGNQEPREALFVVRRLIDNQITYIESLIEADNEDHQ